VKGFDLGKEFLLMMESEGGSGLEVMLVLITYERRSVLLPHDVAEMGLDRAMVDAAWIMWSEGIIDAEEEAGKIVDHHFLVEQWGGDGVSHLHYQPCPES
jgi:hypothetical protein